MFNRRNQISVGIAQTGAVLRIDDIGIQGPDFRFSRQIDTAENNSRIRGAGRTDILTRQPE